MDDLRRIDLNLLLTLHALLTEQHVTRAAVRLHKSQPAVSHALAQLRDIFDDPLLVRRGGALAITTRARALLPALDAAAEAGRTRPPTGGPKSHSAEPTSSAPSRAARNRANTDQRLSSARSSPVSDWKSQAPRRAAAISVTAAARLPLE